MEDVESVVSSSIKGVAGRGAPASFFATMTSESGGATFVAVQPM